MSQTSAAETSINLPELTVERGSEKFVLKAGDSLKPGDIIRNTSSQTTTVGAVSRSDAFPSQTARLAPGATVKVTDRGEASDEVLGLEADSGDVVIADAPAEVADSTEYVITPEIDSAVGLFGAVPLIGGAAGSAALAALGLAALAGGSDDDSGGGAGIGGGGGGGGADASSTNGLAGGLIAVGDGVEQTPLEPVAGVTDAVAGGLLAVGDGLGGVAADDPTGVANLLSNVVGTTVPGDGTSESGLVGLVSELSEGLATGAAGSPLEPLVDPLATTLGNDSGSVDGVAQGLANVESTLAGDVSPLAPLTSGVLAPVVGGSSGQDSGVPGTLNQASEGLTDLTSPDSALAPLAPLTDGLSTGVTTLSDGVAQVGQAIVDASANDPSGVSALVGDLLGGDATASSVSSNAGSSPLDGLTSNLPG